jgi:hypothetical protein
MTEDGQLYIPASVQSDLDQIDKTLIFLYENVEDSISSRIDGTLSDARGCIIYLLEELSKFGWRVTAD